MRKSIFVCLTALLSMVSLSLFAQVNVWRGGQIIASVEQEQMDSVTFTAPEPKEEGFAFSFKDAWHLVITPARQDVDYIWVATSDADYAEYNYASYEEAWQTTVDVAKKWGALEEWNMIVRGNDTINLKDMFNFEHYVLSVASYEEDQRTSPLSTYSFTLTEAGAVPDNGSTATLLLWKDGEIAGQMPLNNIDSITFSRAEDQPMFVLSVSDITNISFRATVTPQDEQMFYFVDYVTKSVADTYSDDDFAQAYLQQLLQRWQYYYPDQSFADAFLYQGTKTLRFTDGVMGNTDYYLVCFAVDVTDNTLASPLYKLPFTTEPTPKNPDLTFTVTVNDRNIATITPSDDVSTYYWGYYGPSDVRKYGTPQEAWQANAAMYGTDYSSHGEERFSIAYQALEAGLHYLVIGGYDGEQTTRLYLWEFEVTEDMLPF